MAMTTWGSTVPNTGALKTSAVSKKIFQAAIAEAVFMEHVDIESDYGPGMGQSVTLTRIGREAEISDYSLNETDRIAEGTFSVTGKVIQVGEFGRAIPCTNLAQTLSTFDVMNETQMALKDSMKLALDSRACRAFKLTPYKYTPTGATSASTATNGTAPTSALANVNVYHLASIRDTLYQTYKCPPVDNGDYVGIFSVKGVRGIKNDPEWEEWLKYTDPEGKFNSEVGRMEQTRIIETNHGGTTFGGFGLNEVGTSDVLGEGVVFGRDACRYIEALQPEIVPGQPDDFGRIKSVCWYGIYEIGIVYDVATVGELRVIHVTSSD